MTPSPRSPAIVYAVWLGADTSTRLANEWGITVEQAKERLYEAYRSGLIVRGKMRRLPTRANDTSLRYNPQDCKGCLVRTYKIRELHT